MRTLMRHVLFVAVLLVLAASAAQAANITVDGTTCILADAIAAANTDTSTGGCAAGGGVDTITLQADVVLATALPDITTAVTLEGNGHTLDGNGGSFSVLRISASGNLTLNNAVVTGGNAISDGGGIYSKGSLTLNSCTVRGNTASNGGGIFAYSSSTVTLTNSTVSGNAATHLGGGLLADFGTTIVLNNSTISSNSSADYGGGILASYVSTVITLNSSIISGNFAASGGKEVQNMGGTIRADSHNLFGHSGETSAQAFDGFTPGATDRSATSDGTQPTALAAILSPLANNGGPTQTHALLAGSPAIDLDAACSTNLTTDQRGFTRPFGNGCDAGSVEFTRLNMVPVYKLLLFKRR